MRRQASHRLAELYRLSALYRLNGSRMDAGVWAFVLAATLGAGKPARVPIGRGHREFRWPGLTLETLTKAIERCGLSGFTDDELVALIRKVKQWQSVNGVRLIGMKRLGEMLNLSAAEREVCKIRSIDAVDEPCAERRIRLAEARKARDREAKKANRKCKPRVVYEAQSLMAKQPWVAAGISRATWYRWRKDRRETGVSTHQIYSLLQHQRTHLSQELRCSSPAGPARTGDAILTAVAGVPSAQGLPGTRVDLELSLAGRVQADFGRCFLLKRQAWSHVSLWLNPKGGRHG
ncbi:hypothetical protein LJD17_10195 [Microvirga rosea]|nr:hypothetical protein [Microvirga rosea]